MKLLKMLQSVDILAINGPVDVEIEDISYDSRTVIEGSMFICIKGNNVDGHDFIDDAIKRGAKASSISSCVTCRFSMTAPSNFRA